MSHTNEVSASVRRVYEGPSEVGQSCDSVCLVQTRSRRQSEECTRARRKLAKGVTVYVSYKRGLMGQSGECTRGRRELTKIGTVYGGGFT